MDPGTRIVHLNWKTVNLQNLKKIASLFLCGIAKRSFTERNATILHGINLGHPRP